MIHAHIYMHHVIGIKQLLTLSFCQVMEHLPSWRPYGSKTRYLPSGSPTRVIALA
jgi:hypothetical protein